MNEKLIPFSTTISDSIEACKEIASDHEQIDCQPPDGFNCAWPNCKCKDIPSALGQKLLDAAKRLEGLRDLANQDLTDIYTSKNDPVFYIRLQELQSKIKQLL